MAIAAWKRIEKSPGFQRRKLFLRRLIGRELWLGPEIDVDAEHSGGWRFDPSALAPGAVVYSLGVGDNIEFDIELVEKYGAELHAFDPTPSSIELIRKDPRTSLIRFHPWAIADADGELAFYPRVRRDGSLSGEMYTLIPEPASESHAIRVPAYSLSSVARKLGHSHIDLLKMDIEGAEYAVLDGLLESPVMPRQLLVEFHHRFPGIGLEKTRTTIGRLRETGYRIFAVSETGREVSFLRQS